MNTMTDNFMNIRGRIRLTLIIIFFISVVWCGVIAAENDPEEKRVEPPNNVEGDIGPSFDCIKASSEVERVMCDSPKLSKLDRELSELYGQLIELPGRKEPLRRDQLKWLREERYACKDATMPPGYDHPKEVAIERCLHPAYSKRIRELRRSEVCHAFSSVVEEYGFEALVESEKLRNNKYGIEVPDVEPVTNENIRALPQKSIKWGYETSESFTEEEKSNLIKERVLSFLNYLERLNANIFRMKADYNNDGTHENVIVIRSMNNDLDDSFFRGRFFVFDNKFRVVEKFHRNGGESGWLIRFMGSTYKYMLGYRPGDDSYLVSVYRLYDQGDLTKVGSEQLCQIKF